MDAYRGFVMLLMASEGLGISHVAEHFSNSGFWKFLDYQVSHVEWRGCALWDLIQPSFSFLVGVAVPFSIASRMSQSASFGRMFLHTLWRSLILIALGVFLRSTHSEQTRFTFEDTLSQIGMGYPFLWLLAWARPRTQAIAAGLILAGYWAAFALYPLPAAGFDPTTVGVRPNWEHWMTGFAAHWNKNANFAHAFDVVFLNWFPRPKPFLYNGGGYLTLSFIPTLGTMILGLLAGGWIRGQASETEKVKRLLIAAAVGFAAGLALDWTGICPSVKRIWTPSWTLFSGAWCAVLFAFFYWTVDVRKGTKWAFPMMVVGMNSIFMYCIAHLWDPFFRKNLKTHLGQDVWTKFAGVYGPILEGVVVLAILWWCCYWLWKKRVFIKV